MKCVNDSACVLKINSIWFITNLYLQLQFVLCFCWMGLTLLLSTSTISRIPHFLLVMKSTVLGSGLHLLILHARKTGNLILLPETCFLMKATFRARFSVLRCQRFHSCRMTEARPLSKEIENKYSLQQNDEIYTRFCFVDLFNFFCILILQIFNWFLKENVTNTDLSLQVLVLNLAIDT